MKDLITELLREKIVLHDTRMDVTTGRGPTIALSNRLVIPLKDSDGNIEETMIVRAHSMHLCVRMAARIILSYHSHGTFVGRPIPYDWNSAWELVAGDYEQAYNAQRWVAVYNNGKVIYENGDRHALLDIIEKCTDTIKGKYEDSIPLAENVIRQKGKDVKIEYDANTALVVNLEKMIGRCGIILRSPNKTTTFNFSVSTKLASGLNIPQCLGTAAAFLEGIQLAFMVGMNNEKIKRGIIARHSNEEKQTQEAAARLKRLTGEIMNLEGTCDVHYRPERPEFTKITMEAEQLAQKIFAPPPKKK